MRLYPIYIVILAAGLASSHLSTEYLRHDLKPKSDYAAFDIYVQDANLLRYNSAKDFPFIMIRDASAS